MESVVNELYEIIKDHRSDIGFMTTERIYDWIKQFEKEDQELILNETLHIMKQRYISKESGIQYIKGIINYLKQKEPFENVKELISNSYFIDNQSEGKSQKLLLNFLDDVLQKDYNTSLRECNSTNPKYVIYLDDFLCTGETAIKGLADEESGWFNALHNNGGTNFENFKASKSQLVLAYLAAHNKCISKFTTRLYKCLGEKNVGSILYVWNNRFLIDNDGTGGELNFLYPTADIIDEEILACQKEIEDKIHDRGYKKTENIQYRKPDNPAEEKFFSNSENRNRYELIILKKCIELYNKIPKENKRARPLGYGQYTDMSLGFGTLIFSWRNVPFNTPLCFWYNAHGFSPLFLREHT